MRKSGVLICCVSLLTLSIVIALSKVAQCIDKLQGDFYNSAFGYIDVLQWLVIVVPFLVGGIMIIADKPKRK